MQGCLFQNAQYVGGHIWGGYHLRYHVVTRRLAYSFSSSATLCLGNYDQRTDVRGQMWSVLTRTVSHSTRALSWYRWATTHLFLNKWSVHQSDLLSHRGLLGSLRFDLLHNMPKIFQNKTAPSQGLCCVVTPTDDSSWGPLEYDVTPRVKKCGTRMDRLSIIEQKIHKVRQYAWLQP